jgi:hypothetical protein
LKYLLFVPEDETDAHLRSNKDAVMTSTEEAAFVASGDEIDSKLVFSDPQRTR